MAEIRKQVKVSVSRGGAEGPDAQPAKVAAVVSGENIISTASEIPTATINSIVMPCAGLPALQRSPYRIMRHSGGGCGVDVS
jgi:hypothetical protein